MERNFRYIISGNPAKNYGGMLKDLEIVANERGIPVQNVIRMFISDLQNLSNEEYEKSIQEINIKGNISLELKSNIITYLNKAIKRYNQSEKIEEQRKRQSAKKQENENAWKLIEESLMKENKLEDSAESIKKLILEINEGIVYTELSKEQRKYVLRSLNKLLEKENKKAKQEEEKQEKLEQKKIAQENARKQSIDKKWAEIVRIVNSEATKKGKSRLELWDAINEAIFGKGEKGKLDISVPESIKDSIKTLIDKEMEIEGSEYYEAVKAYTQDFEFLTENADITFARHGHRTMQKEYLQRFGKFANSLNLNKEDGETEEKLIKRVLSSSNKDNIRVSIIEKKILEMRLNRIKSDREEMIRRRGEEERMW